MSIEELMFLNCGVGKDSLEPCGLWGDQTVNPKGNQSWIFIGRTDAEAETPPDENWLTGKDSDAGKDWGQEEKGTTEDQMVGWYHQLDGHEFEQALGVGDGREAWHATVHGVAKSQTGLSGWTELNWSILFTATQHCISGSIEYDKAKNRQFSLNWSRGFIVPN